MPTYDELLRQTVETFETIQSGAVETIASLEQQIRAAHETVEAAQRRYYVELADLARRRLDGEFQASDERNSGRNTSSVETDTQVEEACRMLEAEVQERFTASAVSDVLDLVSTPMNRSTLNGSLGRLVDRGVLRVVELGYKRRSTIYAVVTPKD